MLSSDTVRSAFERDGLATLPPLYSDAALTELTGAIENALPAEDGFFAVRRFLQVVPGVCPLLFTPALCATLDGLFGPGYRLVKSIYFDKPPAANWFVAGHQDLTIAVAARADVAGFGPWTRKNDQWAVQPPVALLEDNFTLRLHLDDTDAGNGALRVRPGSHRMGVLRAGAVDGLPETVCPVARGGALLMRPLLWHASSRTDGERRRRVLHLEFSKAELPAPLQWAEAEEQILSRRQ